MYKTLGQYIKEIKDELARPDINGQRRRYLEDHLEDLYYYSVSHLDTEKSPTSLELFCDRNPDSVECKIFDT